MLSKAIGRRKSSESKGEAKKVPLDAERAGSFNHPRDLSRFMWVDVTSIYVAGINAPAEITKENVSRVCEHCECPR